MRSLRFLLAFTLVSTSAALALGGGAGATETLDDGVLTPIEVLSHDHQHGEVNGHLPPVQKNVEVVGKLDLFGGTEQPGRISDVGVFGNYAYLGAFREPNCEDTGVYVIDISNPAAPRQVGFLPASDNSYVGEGVQVVDLNTASFRGQVLIHNNENCVVGGLTTAGRGGTSIWDVTDPLNPRLLAAHVGDLDPALVGGLPETSVPHESHSAFGWQQGTRAYMVTVDNAEGGNTGALQQTDIDIFEITNPASPQLVVETGLPHFPQIQETPPPNGNNVFIHDFVVKKVGERYLLLGSYWDGGYIVLDVTDLPARPTFLRDTNFGPVEPFRAEMGLPENWTPEGNAHQAEFSFKNEFILAADEDFGAYRVQGHVKTGPHQGLLFSATQGNNVPQISKDRSAEGPTTFLGHGCVAPPPAASPSHIAIIERGVCTFTVKAQNAQAAGYQAGIVFNDKAGCDALVNMAADANIPFLFVGRTTGLKILNHSSPTCASDGPPPASAGADLRIAAVFDGWGYVHLYDANTMKLIDHWSLPETIDPAYADGFGVLSVHEVATDPNRNRAYLSHYSGGLRVLDWNREDGIKEVGAFIQPGGANFWGVEVWKSPATGEQLVLASDRDAGLWIFRFKRGQGRLTPP